MNTNQQHFVTMMIKNDAFMFVPSKEELLSKKCHFQYKTLEDTYYINDNNDDKSLPQPRSKNWNSLCFFYENITRTVNEKEAYLSRKNATLNARLCWCVDLTTTGLVIDEISIRILCVEDGGGQAIVTLNGDNEITRRKRSCVYFADGEYKTIYDLEDCSVIKIQIDLMGDSDSHVTHLFKQVIDENHAKSPFDIQMFFKRPSYASDRSLLLLGFMVSSKEKKDLESKEKSKPASPNNLYQKHLYIDLVKGDRLPCRKCGKYPRTNVLFQLDSDMDSRKFESKICRKSLNPTWNEFIHFGLSDDWNTCSLQVSLQHIKKFFRRKKEILGYITMDNITSMNMKNRLSSSMPVSSATVFSDMSKRWHSLMSLDNIDVSIEQHKNSNTFKITNTVNETSTDPSDVKKEKKLKRTSSSYSISSSNGSRPSIKNKKRASYKKSLYRSGSVSNILEDDSYIDYTTILAENHWKIVLSNLDSWFYCWHPLVGVHNVLYDYKKF